MSKRDLPAQQAEHRYATPVVKRASRLTNATTTAPGRADTQRPEATHEQLPAGWQRRRPEEELEDDDLGDDLEEEDEPVTRAALTPRSHVPYRAEVQVDREGRPYILIGSTKVILHQGPPPMPTPRRSAAQQAASSQQVRQQRTEPLPREHGRPHWLFVLGAGMLLMLALVLVGGWVMQTWSTFQDDLAYGRPRTFQCDAVIGHHDSPENPSHFIAINRARHIEVIEYPGGDPSRARIFLGPVLFGEGDDLVPVTLSFQDVNGNGKPDMLLHIRGQVIVFLNEQGTFLPLQPGEHVTL